jgi:hypothetical protein
MFYSLFFSNGLFREMNIFLETFDSAKYILADFSLHRLSGTVNGQKFRGGTDYFNCFIQELAFLPFPNPFSHLYSLRFFPGGHKRDVVHLG